MHICWLVDWEHWLVPLMIIVTENFNKIMFKIEKVCLKKMYLFVLKNTSKFFWSTKVYVLYRFFSYEIIEFHFFFFVITHVLRGLKKIENALMHFLIYHLVFFLPKTTWIMIYLDWLNNILKKNYFHLNIFYYKRWMLDTIN